jgi:hypothetical protein
LYEPVLGLLEAGSEFERLTTGLRAVDGRAFGEGWYVWPDIAPPYPVAFFSMPVFMSIDRTSRIEQSIRSTYHFLRFVLHFQSYHLL